MITLSETIHKWFFVWPRNRTNATYAAVMKTVVLGLGNTILTDDGAGIYVTRRLDEIMQSTSNERPFDLARGGPATIKEASIGGFNFIDTLTGYDRAVIIDAIHTKGGRRGEFYELDPDCLKPSARLSSLHGIDFATACNMAKKMNVDFPKKFKIYVIEVENEFSFGERCTPAVEQAIPRMAEEIYTCLKNEGWI